MRPEIAFNSCIPNTQTPPSDGVYKHSDSPTTLDMGDVVNIGSSSSMNSPASTDAWENCSDDWVMNSRCSSNTPPFKYGLGATRESGLPLLSLGPSIVEERGDNMEVDMGSVGLNEDEKAIKWAIVPFEGKQVVNNMDDIMEKIGVKKATNKKPKKQKKSKKPEGNPHPRADQPFVFKQRRGRPGKAIALQSPSNASTGQLPKCINSFRPPMESTSLPFSWIFT
ncbi:hypothetical protein SUGI_0981110 [Cryptomeria japonica]|nr:hypothetical protein SUGI_0981110 [Cryptomeria japonica]